jgi:hypothetical protein
VPERPLPGDHHRATVCRAPLAGARVAGCSVEVHLLVGSFLSRGMWKDHDLLQDMIDGHFKFYKHVNDDPEFAKTFLDLLFERYLGRAMK